jgi:hypothetical protein
MKRNVAISDFISSLPFSLLRLQLLLLHIATSRLCLSRTIEVESVIANHAAVQNSFACSSCASPRKKTKTEKKRSRHHPTSGAKKNIECCRWHRQRRPSASKEEEVSISLFKMSPFLPRLGFVLGPPSSLPLSSIK